MEDAVAAVEVDVGGSVIPRLTNLDLDQRNESRVESTENAEIMPIDTTMSAYDLAPVVLNDMDTLQNIFKYLDLTDLGMCRRVCSQWYYESLPLWLKLAPKITLIPEASPAKKGKFYKIAEFNAKFLSGGSKTSAGYTFGGLRRYQNFAISGFTGLGSERLRDFWKSSAEWIVQLDLTNLLVGPADVFRFQQMILPSCLPNLGKLKVDLLYKPGMCRGQVKQPNAGEVCQVVQGKLRQFEYTLTTRPEDRTFYYLPNGSMMFQPGAPRNQPPFFVEWCEFFRGYPNLTDLQVYYDGSMFENDLDVLFKAIIDVRAIDPRKLSLKSLKINDIRQDAYRQAEDVTFSLSELFQRMRLTLHTLHITFQPTTPGFAIHRILESQAKTLQELRIYVSSVHIPFDTPHMDKLTSLHVVGYTFRSMSFLKCFPNLKYLSLSIPLSNGQSIVCDTSESEMAGVKLVSLKTLVCSLAVPLKPTGIRKFHQWMPNVTDLNIFATNETFSLICKYWPKLEKLGVAGTVDEKGILGITANSADTPRANIANLKELRTFRMDPGSPEFADIKLTRKCVVEGFAKLPKLETLGIAIKNAVANKGFLKAVQEKIIPIEKVDIVFLRENNVLIPLCMECTKVTARGIELYHPKIQGIELSHPTCHHHIVPVREMPL